LIDLAYGYGVLSIVCLRFCFFVCSDAGLRAERYGR
jgi:hypothetical protein